MAENKKKVKQSRGLYLLPNLLTTASLFAGFFAIITAIEGRYEVACIAIFIAMITDALDGRVARMTGAQSDFGAQYDSLSDIVAFGLAPAIIAYSWSLSELGKIGWLSAFIYTSAVALRLARFNTQIQADEKRFFQGLPCPAGAAIIVSAVWLAHKYEMSGTDISIIFASLIVIVGLLMVSNVRYYSFKELDFSSRLPSIVGVVIVLVFAAISLHPPLLLFVAFGVYACSGPVMTLLSLRQKKKSRGKS